MTPYIKIGVSNHFGIMDIAGSLQAQGNSLESWYEHKANLVRQFTTRCMKDSEVLSLTIHNLHLMEHEFNPYYMQLFDTALLRLKNAVMIKLQAIKECQA